MRNLPPSRRSSLSGISLLEILACVAIMIVLFSMVIASLTPNLRRAEGVRCSTNLRNLHVAFGNYVQENGHWPQEPESVADDDTANDDWWIDQVKNYGAPIEVWTCPTIKRMIALRSKDGRPKMHYTPTPFDEKAMTPYKWPNMPWLLEIGDMHGNGALAIFADGSVKPMNVFAPQNKN
ncbi:hypothetical protein BH09VER1_BH09VER1_38430 [soil metagenome]